MIYTIKKGKHYPTPTQTQKVFIAPKRIILDYKVSFGSDCAYSLPGDDMYDVNKLFGVSFGHHHQNSERFGWRYNEKLRMMELLKYSYIDGVRYVKSLQFVYLNQINHLSLEIYVRLNVIDVCYLINNELVYIYERPKPRKFLSTLSYTLGLYFGGNRTAPHNMTINLIKYQGL